MKHRSGTRVAAAILTQRYFPEYVGGGERLAQLTAIGMQAAGVDAQIVTMGDRAREYTHEGLRVSVVCKSARDGDDSLDGWIEKTRPSLMHLIGFWPGTDLGAAARRHRVPFGASGLDYGQFCDNHRLMRPTGSLCAGRVSAAECFRCAMSAQGPRDRFLANAGKLLPPALADASTWLGSRLKGRPMGPQLRWAREFSNRERTRQQLAESFEVYVVPTKFAATVTQPHLSARTRCAAIMHPTADGLKPIPKATPADRLVVGFAGRALEFKGLHVLFDAVAMVPSAIELQIMAATNDGEERHYWEPLKSRAAAAANITWTEPGVLTDELLRQFHRQIDVLAVPSLWPEYVGFVTLEALALGTPVILSDFPTQRELLIDEASGDLIPPGSVTALAEILRKRLASKLSGAAPTSSNPAPTPADYARQILALYGLNR